MEALVTARFLPAVSAHIAGFPCRRCSGRAAPILLSQKRWATSYPASAGSAGRAPGNAPHQHQRRHRWRGISCSSHVSGGERDDERFPVRGGDDNMSWNFGKKAPSLPQDAVLRAISDLSKAEGRVPTTTNLVMGGTRASEEEWATLDEKVNVYPMMRRFTVIGTGGEDFCRSMVGAAESVLLSQVPEARISQRLSQGGKYISVKIGPVLVETSEQVRAVYDAMRRDARMKYFL